MKYLFLKSPSVSEVEQILRLYSSAGWWSASEDPGTIKRIVEKSHCFLSAWDGELLVGMGRALSDTVSDAYIQDVAVLPGYEKQGIGTRLVQMIVDRLKQDGIKWIGLVAENGTWPFYQRLGFRQMKGATPLLMKAPWN